MPALPPSPWIIRFAPLIPAGGRVLDIACGQGRHGRLMLERGHPVTLVDIDTSRVADLADRAEVIARDLEDGAPPPFTGRRFAGVIVTNYLWRPLLPAIIQAVAPGGVLLYETFAAGQERFGRPRRPDFLLRPGELPDAVAGHLHVVAYEHGIVAGARVVQCLCAVAAEGPVSLGDA